MKIKNKDEIINILSASVLFDQFMLLDKTDDTAIKEYRKLRTYISLIPTHRLWDAWESWALSNAEMQIEGLKVLTETCWIDTWKQLSDITMEDDYIAEIFNLLKSSNLSRFDTDEKIIVCNFVSLLWNAGEAFLLSSGVNETRLKLYSNEDIAPFAEHATEQFMISIGAPPRIRDLVVNMIRYSYWDYKLDEVYVKKMIELLPNSYIVTLMSMIRKSSRSTIVGNITLARRLVTSLAKPVSLDATRSYLRNMDVSKDREEEIINLVKTKMAKGELITNKDIFTFVTGEIHVELESTIGSA